MSRTVIAQIDGASRGNPGPAGIGVLIRGEGGEVLKEISKYLGEEKTNNEAEYSALIRALEASRDLEADEVNVLSDSQLLVRQMEGRYNVDSENLKDLYVKARNLESKFKEVNHRHVSREENSAADELANLAIDKEKE